MKTVLTVTSWLAVILGFFAILGSLPTPEYYADGEGLFGGGFFLLHGTLTLVYISQKE